MLYKEKVLNAEIKAMLPPIFRPCQNSRQQCYQILAAAADFKGKWAADTIFLEKSGRHPPM